CERPFRAVVDAVGLAVRHRQSKRFFKQQPRHLGIYSGESIQRILESLSRSHGSGREPCGNGTRRRLVCTALFTLGRGVLGGFKRRLARSRRWEQPLRHGRALSIRRTKAVPWEGFGDFLDEWPSVQVQQRWGGVGNGGGGRRISFLYGGGDQQPDVPL